MKLNCCSCSLSQLPFSDRKPPGVGRRRGRGREDGPPGRQVKGIGRGFEEGGAKGPGGGRGRAGPGGKPGGNRGKSSLISFQNAY
jgi:U6 snRNA-associated Sm-like protein LSm4